MGVLPGSVFISQPKETRITFPKLVISEMKKKTKKKNTSLYSDTGAVCIKFPFDLSVRNKYGRRGPFFHFPQFRRETGFSDKAHNCLTQLI